MGFKINKVFLLLYVLALITGCSRSNFEELEGSDIFYQINAGKTDIIRMRYTIDKGAPSIQLFDKKGNLLQNSVIIPNSILLLTAVKKDSIQITYFVGQSDLKIFLPWFRTNQSNPKRIGNYSIHYNYEIRNTYLESIGSEIDSLSIDCNAQLTSVFFKHKLITKKPAYLFIVKSSEMLLYNPTIKTYTKYTFADKSLARFYMEKSLCNGD